MLERVFVGLTSKEKKIGYFLILPTYFLLGSYIISFLFLQLLKINGLSLTNNQINAYYNFFYDGILVLFCLFLLRQFIKRSISGFKNYAIKDLVWATTSGFVLLYGSQIASNIVTMLLVPESSSANQNAIVELLGSEFKIIAITTVFLAPILEEIIFRGIIFAGIYDKSRIGAYLVSSLLFGSLHILNGVLAGDLTQLVYLLPYSVLGFVFAYSYEKKGTIIVPMYLHMLNNLASVLMILLIS